MSTDEEKYEYCPRCNATLSFQKGYSPELNYWICKGCGEMLINSNVESDIAWICDGCGTMLNVQLGFNENREEWICSECGTVNVISPTEIYTSEEEFQIDIHSPFKGLSDDDLLKLSCYEEIGTIAGREDIILIKDPETDKLFVEKLLSDFDKSIYTYLLRNPIKNMPRIVDIFESRNCLIVVEEYIEGQTVAELIKEKPILEETAIEIVIKVCDILNELHSLSKPIVHRDVKPSNIIVSSEGEVFLLDMNVAKWYDPDKTDDTRYMGTRYYAAPEQVGFGMMSSSAKSDMYAVGVLLNVMLTRKLPKEEKASGEIWSHIKRCISLEAEQRYTATELRTELENLKGQFCG